jgi:hypothetical protein
MQEHPLAIFTFIFDGFVEDDAWADFFFCLDVVVDFDEVVVFEVVVAFVLVVGRAFDLGDLRRSRLTCCV